ncbi:TIGR03086 family metal-binding protein [Streptomyces sedi]|uniref:TIGR03086 family protein n=1 Tax=Streptomyces sedi TaxID=555059 RepID=A0A5C4VFH1_9ACTN|nr:TIGR03086 family metal-binding protein [Streptomyces sedi]TNM34335.1 TIGR03086 family protein [Streptomyces sedi]
MTGSASGLDLLTRAVSFGRDSVDAVAPHHLDRPTPCAEWNVRALLGHLNESMALLQKGADSGCLTVPPSTGPGGAESSAELIAEFHRRSGELLRGWPASAGSRDLMEVGGLPLATDIVAVVGAIEIAVHGWDLGIACGAPRPISAELASDMLTVLPVVLGGAPHEALFAAPVVVAPTAGPGDRLVALLGRSPTR